MLKNDSKLTKYERAMMKCTLKALPLQPHYCTTILFLTTKFYVFRQSKKRRDLWTVRKV